MPTVMQFDPADIALRFADALHDPFFTTPADITPQVDRFCQMFARDPEFVPVESIAGERANDCINVVRRKVERDGGEVVIGWQLWEWPGMYVEAELHAVWRSPADGTLLDVSPKANGEQRILFMPDPLQTLGESRTDNIRFPFSEHRSVQAFIEWCEHKFRLIGPAVKERTVKGDEAYAIVHANYQIAYHLLEMRKLSDRAAVERARARSHVQPKRA